MRRIFALLAVMAIVQFAAGCRHDLDVRTCGNGGNELPRNVAAAHDANV